MLQCGSQLLDVERCAGDVVEGAGDILLHFDTLAHQFAHLLQLVRNGLGHVPQVVHHVAAVLEQRGHVLQVLLTEQPVDPVQGAGGLRRQFAQGIVEAGDGGRRGGDGGNLPVPGHKPRGVALLALQLHEGQAGDPVELERGGGVGGHRCAPLDLQQQSDLLRVVRIEVHLGHGAHVHAAVLHRGVGAQVRHRFGHEDLVVVVLLLAAVLGQPVGEAENSGGEQEHEQSHDGVVDVTAHVHSSGVPGRPRRTCG